jgi:hypothetical protein
MVLEESAAKADLTRALLPGLRAMVAIQEPTCCYLIQQEIVKRLNTMRRTHEFSDRRFRRQRLSMFENRNDFRAYNQAENDRQMHCHQYQRFRANAWPASSVDTTHGSGQIA